MWIAVAAVVGFVVSLAACLGVMTAIGLTYLPTHSRTRERLRGELLYHYCADTEITIDPATQTFTKVRRRRTREPWVFGRRAIYFYAGHAPRRPKSNHPRLRHSRAAVTTLAGRDLLTAIGDAPIWYRRRDHALAVFADYCGPYLDIARGIELFAPTGE